MATLYVNKSGWDATRVFTVSGITTTPLAGATYTNNAVTFTVVGATVTGTAPNISGYLFCTGSGAPAASGTLTKTGGTGDATIAFSDYQAGGSSLTAAYKTIQGCINASASGDSIGVGSGSYNEKIYAGSRNLNFYALGTVILDSNGLSSGYLISVGAGAYHLKFLPSDFGGNWVFKNNTGIGIVNTVGTTGQNYFVNCTFISANNQYGVYCTTNTTHYFTNCVFLGYFTTALIYIAGSVNIVYCYNCTFYGYKASTTPTAVVINNTATTFYISKCIFSNYVKAYSASTISYAADNQYYNITNWTIGGSTYTTLAQVQALNPFYETRSVVANPNFTDPANNIMYLKSASPIANDIGAYPYSFTQGAANDSLGTWNIAASADNSGWYNPDTNVAKNGTTGYLELTAGTTGVIWSPVYDIGSVQSITRVNLSSLQTWPTNMIDTTKTDTLPNYQTIEIRASNTTFDQNDAVLSWTEVKTDIAFSIITGRYVQLRLTLRNDDVAA